MVKLNPEYSIEAESNRAAQRLQQLVRDALTPEEWAQVTVTRDETALQFVAPTAILAKISDVLGTIAE